MAQLISSQEVTNSKGALIGHLNQDVIGFFFVPLPSVLAATFPSANAPALKRAPLTPAQALPAGAQLGKVVAVATDPVNVNPGKLP